MPLLTVLTGAQNLLRRIKQKLLTWEEDNLSADVSVDSGKLSCNSDASVIAVSDNDIPLLVKVYTNASGTWTQMGAGMNTSYSVGISKLSKNSTKDNARIVVPSADLDKNLNYVSVFQYSSSTDAWTILGNSISMPTSTGFGEAVDINGDGTRIVVSAPDESTSSGTGKVRIYEYISAFNVWEETANIDGRGNRLIAMSKDGSTVATSNTFSSSFYNTAIETFAYSSTFSPGGFLLSFSITPVGGSINIPPQSLARSALVSDMSLSGDGTKIVIGAPFAATANGTGYVEVYSRESGSSWSSNGILAYGDVSGSDEIGERVAMSADGNYLVFTSLANNGTISVYKVGSNNSWDLYAHTLNASDLSGLPKFFTTIEQIDDDLDGEFQGDNFGYSVSLSYDGYRLAAGAREFLTGSGYVKVFQSYGTEWIQMGPTIYGDDLYDSTSGLSVSLSADGSRMAFGTPYVARTRVYEWTGSEWDQLGADIDGEAAGDRSGHSVSLSGDGSRIAIGANYSADNGVISGHVRILEWTGTSWVQMGSDIDGEASFDESGYSVALSDDGSRVVIGAPTNDGNGNSSGHVRVYEWSGSSWVQLGADIDGDDSSNFMGFSVSISADGNRFAAGAYNSYEGAVRAGSVRVFEWSGSVWNQLGSDIGGEAAENYFGYSVSLSADGTRVAAGATGNDDNGTDSGHVRIFEWTGSVWTQLGNNIDGEAEFDQSGRAVSLSGNGTRVAVGAPSNDEAASNAGHVRVFRSLAETTRLYVDIADDGSTIAVGGADFISWDASTFKST